MKTSLPILILTLFLACTGNGEMPEGDMAMSYMEEAAPPDTRNFADRKMAADQSGNFAPQPEEEIVQQVIKTGNIDFETEDIEKTYAQIKELMPAYKAYLENEHQSRSDLEIRYSLLIRVPAERYDSLFNAVLALPMRLQSKSSNAQDVTEQYYDLKTRIKNKQALEERYLQLLKKATDIKDMLEIENSLNQVRTEIENLQGRFNYLSKQVSFSTLHLSFYETLPYTYNPGEQKGFGAKILGALNSGWMAFLSFLVVFIGLWPFLILIAAGIYIMMIIKKRRRARSQTK